MNDERSNKTQLRAYLLGEVEDSVAQQLEERCFIEPAWREALETEREGLLDAWAREELAPLEKEKLEARLVALPALRERAEFARSLHQHFSGTDTSQAQRSPSGFRSFVPAMSQPRHRFRHRFRWTVAIIAALVLIASGWLSWVAWRSRPNTETKLTHIPSPSPVETAKISIPGSSETPVREISPPVARQTPAKIASEPEVASFVLATAHVRGDDTSPELSVPARAKTLRLQVELPFKDVLVERGALQNSDGKVVWQQSALNSHIADGVRYVVCDVPLGLLEDGDYQLRLTQSAEIIGIEMGYSFQIIRD